MDSLKLITSMILPVHLLTRKCTQTVCKITFVRIVLILCRISGTHSGFSGTCTYTYTDLYCYLQFQVNPNIKFEVFIHKVDGLSDDHKIGKSVTYMYIIVLNNNAVYVYRLQNDHVYILQHKIRVNKILKLLRKLCRIKA